MTSPPPFADGYEILSDQPFLPDGLDTEAVLVRDPRDMPALWDHYQLGGEPEEFAKGAEVALFVGTGESGSCPIEIEDASVEGSELTITTEDVDGPCTADFVPRTFVFLFRAEEAPAAGGTVTIQGAELKIRPAEAVVSAGRIVFPLQEPSNLQMEALLKGVLIEQDDCLYVRGQGSRRTILPIWRHGFGFQQRPDGIEILDDTGEVVARVGGEISMAGGVAPRPLPGTLKKQVGHCDGPFWIAGEISR